MLKAVVDGEIRRAAPQCRGECPVCGEPVLAKCGQKKVWHWSHLSRFDCDNWYEPETPWHAAWKSRFEQTEVTIERLGQRHRADAVGAGGVVIEFQHSGLGAAEVLERENFYRNMVWVIDCCQQYRKSKIGIDVRRPENGREYVAFKWLHRKTSFDDCEAPIFLDLGVAFVPVGEPFYKQGRWWDDGEGGVRDGKARQEGIWQRGVHTTVLLEVKAKTDRAGWGRIVSHEDFCRRFGGECDSSQRRPGLYLCAGDWAYRGDGMHYRFEQYEPMDVRLAGAYGWCHSSAGMEVNR